MKQLLILLLIGISLSIDAFSISTVIGMTKPQNNKIWFTSVIVGTYHFVMPILGLLLENQFNKIININSNIVLGVILILLSMQMFIEYINPSKKEINLSTIGIILFGLCVSLDSFTIGLGIKAITNNIILSSTIFSLCSFSFTYIGLSLGKYISYILKKRSYLLGSILLLLMGISFLCKIA